MKRDEILAKLKAVGACVGALAWVESQPASATMAGLWRDCPRADWMLWLAARSGGAIDEIRAAAWACAHMADAWAPDSYWAAYAARLADYADYADAAEAAAAAYAAARAADCAAARAQCRADCADLVRLLVARPVLT